LSKKTNFSKKDLVVGPDVGILDLDESDALVEEPAEEGLVRVAAGVVLDFDLKIQRPILNFTPRGKL
jgi:hypothetical protein